MRLQVLSGHAKGLGDLDFAEFADPETRVAGLLGEALVAVRNCPAVSRRICSEFTVALMDDFSELDVFATPITPDGLSFQRDTGFRPLHKDGMRQVFWRPAKVRTQFAAE